MKFLFYERSFILCFCAIFCFAATVAQACAQSQQQPSVLLALKACDRELRVFDDRTVVESRRGTTTKGRLSESRMRKLRELIAGRPCIKEWQQSTSSTSALIQGEVKLSTTDHHDCIMEWLSAGIGLDEIQVTIRSPDEQIGPFPVYVVCDHAKEGYKKAAKINYQRFLKPNWQRFLADISKALGGATFLKGCYCWQV